MLQKAALVGVSQATLYGLGLLDNCLG